MVPVFHGTCAICEVGIPWGRRPSRPRTICHSKECAREASRYGARVRAARRKRMAPSPPKTEHRCPRCEIVKPLSEDHRYVIARAENGSVIRYDVWCKPCRCRYERVDDLTPEALEARRARKREKERRRAARIAADPQRLERERAKRRAQKRRQQTNNPNLARDAQRRYRAKLASDPERLEARREAERMRYRLRREREGKEINVRASKTTEPSPQGGYMPAAPLVAALERWLERQTDAAEEGREAALASIGVEPRSMRGWKSGERKSVRWAVADDALTGMGLHWWDVWTEPEDRAKAEELWEGPPRQPRQPRPANPWPAGQPVPDLIGEYEAKRKATREARKARRAERQAA